MFKGLILTKIYPKTLATQVLVCSSTNKTIYSLQSSFALPSHTSAKGKRVVHTFLSVVQLEQCDAISIVNAAKESLRINKLNLKNLPAISTDNA